MQDISLSKPEEPKGVHHAVSTGALEVIPIETSDDESMVADTTDETTTHTYMAQDVHQTTKEAPTEP